MNKNGKYDLAKILYQWADETRDAIYIADSDGITLKINKAYQKMSGYQPSDLVGKSLKNLVSKGYFSSAILLALEKKEPVTIVGMQFKSKKHLISAAIPIKDPSGKIYAVVATHRDISEYEKLQDEYERLKGELERAESLNKELLNTKELVSEDVIPGNNMQQILRHAIRIAPYPINVYLYGESGVGKEVIANLIVEKSDRNNRPFIKVNCSAIPEQLLESELFGYNPGAFTGARASGKPGLFELADHGTILLDEIGDMSLRVQAKVLRAIQEQEITRVGGVEPKKIDVRIISATNKDLLELVKKNKFREDLFFRLNVVQIKIPPLRERKDEILPLADLFTKKFGEKYGLKKEFSQEAKRYLLGYDWPGNIRELQNVIENALVSTNSTVIQYDDLADRLEKKNKLSHKNTKVTLKEAVNDFEKQIIIEALKENNSIRAAARILGVDHSTLIRKIGKYNLEKGKYGSAIFHQQVKNCTKKN